MKCTEQLIKETFIRLAYAEHMLAHAEHYASFPGYELTSWLERQTWKPTV